MINRTRKGWYLQLHFRKVDFLKKNSTERQEETCETNVILTL